MRGIVLASVNRPSLRKGWVPHAVLTLDTQELIELEQVAVQDAVKLAAVQGYCSRLAIRGRKPLSQLTVAFLHLHQHY